MTKINRRRVAIAVLILLFAVQFYSLFFFDHEPNLVMFSRTRPENMVFYFTALVGACFAYWYTGPAARNNAPGLAIAGCVIVLLIDALVLLNPALATTWMLLLVTLAKYFVNFQIVWLRAGLSSDTKRDET